VHKIEKQLLFLTLQSSTSFVLKLCGRYVPGLETVQASILQ